MAKKAQPSHRLDPGGGKEKTGLDPGGGKVPVCCTAKHYLWHVWYLIMAAGHGQRQNIIKKDVINIKMYAVYIYIRTTLWFFWSAMKIR